MVRETWTNIYPVEHSCVSRHMKYVLFFRGLLDSSIEDEGECNIEIRDVKSITHTEFIKE